MYLTKVKGIEKTRDVQYEYANVTVGAITLHFLTF